MYKRKERKKKFIIITVILLIILLPVTLKLDRKTRYIENFFKDSATIISKIVMYPFTSLNDEKNIKQDKSKTILENSNKELEDEIKELKKELELNKTITEFKPINATVINRNKAYWFNTITIDKGKKSGIKEDMAVITSDGLVGKITKVSNLSSEVKLITTDDINYKVSVGIKSKDDETYGILNGYNKDENTITISGIDRSIDISKGDTVKTSGLGGVFPSGIYVGKVVKVTSDKYDLSKTAYIKTKQNFNKIHYVTVLGDAND